MYMYVRLVEDLDNTGEQGQSPLIWFQSVSYNPISMLDRFKRQVFSCCILDSLMIVTFNNYHIVL